MCLTGISCMRSVPAAYLRACRDHCFPLQDSSAGTPILVVAGERLLHCFRIRVARIGFKLIAEKESVETRIEGD
jgi:hypothetical protein